MKHFIDLNNFSNTELRKILKQAIIIKRRQNSYSFLLKNKSLGLIFTKQSTRTRLSFSIGMQKLGGNVIELDSKQIGLGTRESTEDVLKALSQYIDILVIRNNDHKKLMNLAAKNILPIINGLSDFSHPCQVLSDVFTIEEKIGSIKQKKIVWLGDVNNVLISLIHAAEIFKFNLNILTDRSLFKRLEKIFNYSELRYTFLNNSIDNAIQEADCIITDAWISMGEKNSKYKKQILRKFQVNLDIMKKTKKNAIFMHCLPAHRSEEVTNDVIDGNKSVVWQQAKNRLYVQQSILCHLMNYVKK